MEWLPSLSLMFVFVDTVINNLTKIYMPKTGSTVAF